MNDVHEPAISTAESQCWP